MKKLIFLILLIASLTNLNAQNKHEITVKIDGLSQQELILGYFFGDKKFAIDTVTLDQNGQGVFKGDSLLKGGIYLMILPEKTYFEVMIADDQQFTVQTKADDVFGSLSFVGSDENSKFLDYQQFMSKNGMEMQKQREALQTETDEAKKAEIEKQLKEGEKAIREYMLKTVSDNKGSFLANLINALISPEIPEFTVPENIQNKDSAKWVLSYNYNKAHYWDNINLKDSRLLRTPLFKNKLDTYFKRVIIQMPDTLIPEVDAYLNKCYIANKEVFQYSLSELLSSFAEAKIMGLDALVVHLAENYYLNGKADWATDELKNSLQEYVNKTKPNLIGKKAPALKVETLEGDYVDMYQIDSKFTIVIFWETNCGHCKKTVPALYEIYKKYDEKELQVMAIYTQGDQPEWTKFVEEKGLHWINAWDPYNHSNFRLNYGVETTPSLFLLDKDKKIIAKKIDIETIEKFIDRELKK